MRRRILIPALCLLLAACHVPAGSPHPSASPTPRPDSVSDSARAVPPDVERFRPEVEGLIADALGRGQSYALLSELCRVAPLRLSGSVGAEHAVEWAENAMRRCGLVNVRREPVRVPRWVRGELEFLARLDAAGLPAERYPILALGGSVATPPGGVSGELVEVRDFEELARRADEVRGKIVLFNRPMDVLESDCFAAYGGAVNQRSTGAVEAAKVGALAAIVRSMTMSLDDYPHTGATRYDPSVQQIPIAAVSTLGAEDLARRLRSGERVRLNLQLSCRTLGDVDSANVVGEIRGDVHPEQVLVLGGHLDAWDVGHGAHDDGAGCVHALEAARLIVARGLKPKRTIRVVMFMNEENGARGAEAYFKTHESELAHHVLALESDAGGFTPRGFSTDAKPETFATLAAAARVLERASATQMIVGWGGVDIGPMAKAAVPLVGFRPDDERYFDHHHSARDTIDQVHSRELALGAGAISGLAWILANLE